MNRNANRGEPTFTGRHMLMLTGAFFGVVIAANLALAVLANTSWSGLVVANSYVASQTYNGVIKAAREQEALGWHDRFAATGDELALTLADSEGRPLSGLTVTVIAGRPSHGRDDRELVLTEAAAGTYAAPARLAAGAWQARVVAADADGRSWRQTYRFVVRKAD
jgi:nitrogen fixation protein FixH